MDGNDTGLSLGEWALLVLFLVVGLGYALWSAILGMAQGQDQLSAFTVPGEVLFEIERPGSYLIYNKIQRSADSQEFIRPPGYRDLRVDIQHVESGERLPLEDAREEASFVIRRSLAESLYRFRASQPGQYRALAQYDDAEASGAFTFVVAQDFRQQLLGGFRRAGFVAFITFCAVGVLAYRATHRGKREARP